MVSSLNRGAQYSARHCCRTAWISLVEIADGGEGWLIYGLREAKGAFTLLVFKAVETVLGLFDVILAD
jgi:hypothetical protein